jgi:hypothetical protein
MAFNNDNDITPLKKCGCCGEWRGSKAYQNYRDSMCNTCKRQKSGYKQSAHNIIGDKDSVVYSEWYRSIRKNSNNYSM